MTTALYETLVGTDVLGGPKTTANHPQSVCRKCYNEWGGSSGTSTPTDVKGKTEEILLTIVGEDIILPQNHRPPNPIGLSMTTALYETLVGVDVLDDPCEQTQTNPNRSVENATTNGADSRGRLSLQKLMDMPKKIPKPR